MRSRQMQAAVVAEPRKIQIREVPVPDPGPTEVRVRIRGCGVCGSNLPPWEGRPWFHYPLAPGELGHEGWGEIDAAGREVRDLQEGQPVAVLSCHSFAEYDIAPASAVVPVPAELAGQPFPGEALGCAMNVFRRCEVQPEHTVAIVGIGFLGAILTALCAATGARVLAVGRRPFSLEVARRLGAAKTFRIGNGEDPLTQIRDLLNGQGCERVIEAAGEQEPLDLASELTRERGRLIIAGYHQDGPRRINLQLWNWRGLDVINAHERDPQVYRAGVEAAVAAIAGGRLNPFPLFTHHFPLEQLGAALDLVRERPPEFMKALVTL